MTLELRGFTRKEAMESTGCTSNQLQSYERAKLVIPKRVEQSGRATVLYTRRQLLQLCAIKNLREKEKISLQKIKAVIKFLDSHGFDTDLDNKQLVVLDDAVFWVRIDWEDFSTQMPKALKVASKKRKEVGQYMLLVIPPLINVAEEIIKAAKKSRVINVPSFMERFNRAA